MSAAKQALVAGHGAHRPSPYCPGMRQARAYLTGRKGVLTCKGKYLASTIAMAPPEDTPSAYLGSCAYP